MYERETVVAPDAATLQKLYERGFSGAYWNPESAQRFADSIEADGGQRYGEDACRQYRIENAGAGKLSLPYMAVTTHFPNAIPGKAQQRGDCVSFSTRTAVWVSYMSELVYGSNTMRHRIPELSQDAEQSGCISSEAIYWYRGHGGDGWQCAEAADVALHKSSMWLRQDYPELGIDLTNYSPSMAGKWGASPPPDRVTDVGSATYAATQPYAAPTNQCGTCWQRATHLVPADQKRSYPSGTGTALPTGHSARSGITPWHTSAWTIGQRP